MIFTIFFFSDFNCYWRFAICRCHETAIYLRGCIERVWRHSSTPEIGWCNSGKDARVFYLGFSEDQLFEMCSLCCINWLIDLLWLLCPPFFLCVDEKFGKHLNLQDCTWPWLIWEFHFSCRFVDQVNATIALLHPIHCTRDRKVDVEFDLTTIPAFLIVLGILYVLLKPRRPKPKINWDRPWAEIIVAKWSVD